MLIRDTILIPEGRLQSLVVTLLVSFVPSRLKQLPVIEIVHRTRFALVD